MLINDFSISLGVAISWILLMALKDCHSTHFVPQGELTMSWARRASMDPLCRRLPTTGYGWNIQTNWAPQISILFGVKKTWWVTKIGPPNQEKIIQTILNSLECPIFFRPELASSAFLSEIISEPWSCNFHGEVGVFITWFVVDHIMIIMVLISMVDGFIRRHPDNPSGKLTVCYRKWPIYSWFTHKKWGFSIVM